MEIIRVTREWQRAGVHYVRVQAMVPEFGVSLDREFNADTPEDIYILALDGVLPVSTCRLKLLGGNKGKIERVATIGDYRNRGIGSKVILAAEKWLQEKDVTEIIINSRVAALAFYEKLGYVADNTTKSGTGDFVCVNVTKKL